MSEIPNIGDIFDDRYEIEQILGSGSHGTVFRAIQLDCRRQVALKILHSETRLESLDSSSSLSLLDAIEEEYRTRFLREAKALSKFSHINIVTVYHVGISDTKVLYTVMEYVEGQNVRELIDATNRLAVLRALRIVRAAARAMFAVHERGMIHRDLKPENILIAQLPEPDTVKLVDFGLVRQTNQPELQKLTCTGQVMGTSKYMSPEQCQGEPLDFRTDIYSLSSCLYEMLTGRAPFEADTPVGLMYKHVNQAVPRVEANQVDLFHPGLNSLVAKGMSKDPKQRFNSMEDMANQIDRVILLLENRRSRRANVQAPVLVVAGLAFLCAAMSFTAIVIWKRKQLSFAGITDHSPGFLRSKSQNQSQRKGQNQDQNQSQNRDQKQNQNQNQSLSQGIDSQEHELVGRRFMILLAKTKRLATPAQADLGAALETASTLNDQLRDNTTAIELLQRIAKIERTNLPIERRRGELKQVYQELEAKLIALESEKLASGIKQGKYEDAVSVGQQIVHRAEIVYGENAPQVIVSLRYLASVYEQLRDHSNTKALIERIYKIRTTGLPGSSPDLKNEMKKLATELWTLEYKCFEEKKWQLAQELDEEILRIDPDERPPSEAHILALFHLATLYGGLLTESADPKNHHFTEAEALLKKGERLTRPARKLNSKSTDAELATANTHSSFLEELARQYAWQCKYRQAISLAREIIAIRLKECEILKQRGNHPDWLQHGSLVLHIWRDGYLISWSNSLAQQKSGKIENLDKAKIHQDQIQ